MHLTSCLWVPGSENQCILRDCKLQLATLFLVNMGYGLYGIWILECKILPKKNKGSHLLRGAKDSEIRIEFCLDKLGSKLDSNKKYLLEVN